MAATLKTIARELNLSVSAVSRALRDNPDENSRIPAATREKVKRVARRLGYSPHRGAQCLRGRRNATIGLFFPTVPYRLYADLMFGACGAATEAGFAVCFYPEKEVAGYRAFVRRATEASYAGIVTFPIRGRDPEIARLMRRFLKQGGHAVVVGETEPLLPDVPGVAIDNRHGARLAAERLLERGCDTYLAFGGREGRDRLFEEVIIAAGARVERLHADEAKLAERFAHGTGRIGVFAASDKQALTVMRIAREAGRTLGDDALLIGYNDLYLTDALDPPLTTVRLPFREIGELAIRKLANMIEGGRESSEDIRPDLVVRETA